MKITFVWKELSEDGLLKDPQNYGPHYDEYNVNDYDGCYNSEEEAVTGLDEFLVKHDGRVYCEYVLVKIYDA